MAISNQTDFYLNLNQLSDMKLGARSNAAEASQGVAQQFESLFIQQMLTAMRSAVTVDESNHNSYTDFYQEMQDKQLALTMAKQGGIGIAKFIMQQLPGGQDSSGNSGDDLPLHRWQEVSQAPMLEKMGYQAENPAVKVKALVADDLSSAIATQISSEKDNLIDWSHSSAFVSDVWPQAKIVSRELGISPKLLVAQSALETGWGKHIMRNPDGSPAYNLFGIKAGSNWQGDTVTKPTLEFRDGIMQTEIAHFRAYDSIADSLNDYVDFLQTRGRYQQALEHGGSDKKFIQGLQQAGYATDPRYADKVLSIMQGDVLQRNLSALSTGNQQALNGETKNA